jgi:hypothetical protein
MIWVQTRDAFGGNRAMDRRRHLRLSLSLPVRIWGMDAHAMPFMQLASAVNISSSGARIQGLRRQVRAGEILEVQMGEEKAQFRVTWVGKLGSRRQGQLGIERLASEPTIWDFNFPHCVQHPQIPGRAQ